MRFADDFVVLTFRALKRINQIPLSESRVSGFLAAQRQPVHASVFNPNGVISILGIEAQASGLSPDRPSSIALRLPSPRWISEPPSGPDEAGFELGPEDEAALLESIQQADRGEVVSAEELLRELGSIG